jgi:hypothetical protein
LKKSAAYNILQKETVKISKLIKVHVGKMGFFEMLSEMKCAE